MSRTVILQPRAEEDILVVAGNIPDPLVGARWFDRILGHIGRLSDSAEWYGLADETDDLGGRVAGDVLRQEVGPLSHRVSNPR